MKKLHKLFALMLVLALAIGLAVPIAAEEANKAPVMQALKMLHRSKASSMDDSYVYPYASSIGAAAYLGKHTLLQFKLNHKTPKPTDIFCVAIMTGTAQDVIDGRPSTLVEYREYDIGFFSAPNYSLGMTWQADPEYYRTGSHAMLCFVISEEGEIYDQDMFISDLAVINSTMPASNMSVKLVENGRLVDAIYGNMTAEVGDELYFCALGYPYGHSPRQEITAVSSKPGVASIQIESDGYIHVTTHAIGWTDITVKYGNMDCRFTLKVGHLDGFVLLPGSKHLCVGITDTIQIITSPPNVPVYFNWYEPDPSIVTVKDGVVTAIGPGEAMVSVEAANIHHGEIYTVSYHELPEGTPVSERTATQPAAAVGHCSVCNQDNSVNVYEKAIFPDTIANAWYAEHVDYVYDKGIMNGTSENTFGPDMALSRAMVVTVLYRIAGEPEVTGEIPFTDVAAGTWYSDAVLWASQNNIVNGVGDDRFAPNDNITREQIATILYRYSQFADMEMAEGADLSTFPDHDNVGGFAQEGLSWAVAEELISGTVSGGVTYLSPKASATRAQFATIISRYQQMFQDAAE